jgi:hypothetical protein
MPYFTNKDIAAISIGAALWAILNILISPIFFQMTRLPFLCDLLAFASLILVTWLTRKFGAASLTGIIATLLTLILRPAAFHMLGFIAASIAFDILTRAIGYKNCFAKNPYIGSSILVLVSIFCSGIAGAIIGVFFMSFEVLTGIFIWVVLHAVGGLLGGLLGVIIVRSLVLRKISPMFD